MGIKSLFCNHEWSTGNPIKLVDGTLVTYSSCYKCGKLKTEVTDQWGRKKC
jgi:hypothetical protein